MSVPQKPASSNDATLAPADSASQPPPPMPAPDLAFPFASQADIIRAEQKDAYLKFTLREMFKDVYGYVFGTRSLLTNLPVLSTASDAVYYSLTSLVGSQTLGEEYTEILPYSVSTDQFPSLPRRAAWVGVHVFGPFLFGRFLNRAVRENQMGGGYVPDRPRLAGRLPENYKDEDHDGFPDEDQEPLRKISLKDIVKEQIDRIWRYFVRWAPTLRRFLGSEFRALHLAIFYFIGAYYNLANRILRIRYIFTRQFSPNEQPISYEFLGFLIAIQLVVSLILRLRGSKALSSDPDSAEEEAERQEEQGEEALAAHMEKLGIVPVEQKKCTLCLEPRKVPTSTPCGHVFCWKCIGDWCQNKPECPLCRQDINPSHLIPLTNYA